jgi:hypothetical protein
MASLSLMKFHLNPPPADSSDDSSDNSIDDSSYNSSGEDEDEDEDEDGNNCIPVCTTLIYNMPLLSLAKFHLTHPSPSQSSSNEVLFQMELLHYSKYLLWLVTNSISIAHLLHLMKIFSDSTLILKLILYLSIRRCRFPLQNHQHRTTSSPTNKTTTQHLHSTRTKITTSTIAATTSTFVALTTTIYTYIHIYIYTYIHIYINRFNIKQHFITI